MWKKLFVNFDEALKPTNEPFVTNEIASTLFLSEMRFPVIGKKKQVVFLFVWKSNHINGLAKKN